MRYRSGLAAAVLAAGLLIAGGGGDRKLLATDAVVIDDTAFQVAQGWSLQQVAAEPLVRYPVHADLAPDGRLFVVESSGSSAPVKEQLEQRPHRLVVLEDTDGDGRFDKRAVFAEGLMLPQGVLWTPEGVLVAAPPEIWRFRDTTGDGAADDRSVWFDGKTLTGCANDLHGPFVGRDGWIYWCKGAFAEQQYDRGDGSSWSTRASHLFRRHGRTGVIESVMTGGMDNPVEFAMSLCGERFFTCTFIQHPADGLRDALVHAVYGGVYGKDHGVLDGHPRTGPLMPVMTHLGPAAPAGVAMRDSVLTDSNLLGELVVAQFNLQKVSRHVLAEQGTALVTVDSDLLVAERPDFHPTDVLEDADGSLLVIDTGGWYTLCCPTSHIDQSRATGGIYRLTPPGNRPDDPRGESIAWEDLDAAGLVELLGDQRPAVRSAARMRLIERAGDTAITSPLLDAVLPGPQRSSSALLRSSATWCLIELAGKADPQDAESLFEALVQLVDDPSVTVLLAAVQGLAAYRYAPALESLLKLLADGQGREQRYAAEALGRLGSAAAAQGLLAIVPQAADDRALHHALLYALIEIGHEATPVLTAALQGDDVLRRSAALRVLDQMEASPLRAEAVLATVQQGTDTERELAVEILARRSEWDNLVARELPKLLDQGGSAGDDPRWQETIQRLVTRAGLAAAVAEVIATGPAQRRMQVLAALVARPPSALPAEWTGPIASRLTGDDSDKDELRGWAQVLAASAWKEAPPQPLIEAFTGAMRRHQSDDELWLKLAAAAPPGASWPSGAERADERSAGFRRLIATLDPDAPPHHRQLALTALSRQRLSPEEQTALAAGAGGLGPMELAGVLQLLRRVHDVRVNRALLESLALSDQQDALSGSLLEDHFREHPEEVRALAVPLVEHLAGDQGAQRQAHLSQLLSEMPGGDPLRGLQLFRSSRAACSACHAIAYHGGRIGPDLTRINRIRTEKDLLEAIVYPSASFVRSYESFLVMTDDGRALNGVIADEDLESITLVTGIDQRTRIPRDEIETMRPSPVSIMPAGLDQQLTLQELADLIAFLKSQR